MKRLLLLLMFTIPALGQSGRYQTCSLQTALGQAVAGAKVYFLTQPANTTALTPLATVYSNATETGGPVTQPVLTNGFGECTAYLAPGVYTVVYISPAIGQLNYPDQNIAIGGGAPSSPAFGAITSGTNTTAAMVVGSGASLAPTGTGTIGATSIDGVSVTGTPGTGQVITATSPTSAIWSNGGGGGGSGVLFSGTPQGTVNGINTSFILTNAGVPLISAPTQAFVWDNFPLVQGVGYTVAGTIITFTTAPAIGDVIWAQGTIGAGGVPASVLTNPIGNQTVVQPPGTSLNVNDFNQTVYANNYATMASAEAALPSGGTIVVTTVIPVTATHTTPANISYIVYGGGGFNVSSGQTLTFAWGANFTAPQVQVFFGPGTVLVHDSLVQFPQWWGALGNFNGISGHDDTVAIQDAVNSAETVSTPISCGTNCPANGSASVVFPDGNYQVTAPILLSNDMDMYGQAIPDAGHGAKIYQNGSAGNDTLQLTATLAGGNYSIRNLVLRAISGGSGALIHVLPPVGGVHSVVNSLRVSGMTFFTPQGIAVFDEVGDDHWFTDNTFDTSATTAFELGTATGEISNMKICGNTFFAYPTFIVLVVNVDGLMFCNNRVYSNTTTNELIDANILSPVLANRIQVLNNQLDSVTQGYKSSFGNLTWIGNTVTHAGSSFFQFLGTVTNINIQGGSISGAFTGGPVVDLSAATTTNLNISGVNFVATTASPVAINYGFNPHPSTIIANTFSGFTASTSTGFREVETDAAGNFIWGTNDGDFMTIQNGVRLAEGLLGSITPLAGIETLIPVLSTHTLHLFSGITDEGPICAASNGVCPSQTVTTGTPTVGQAACIKAAGPPVVIGYCSTVVSALGACTCN